MLPPPVFFSGPPNSKSSDTTGLSFVPPPLFFLWLPVGARGEAGGLGCKFEEAVLSFAASSEAARGSAGADLRIISNIDDETALRT